MRRRGGGEEVDRHEDKGGEGREGRSASGRRGFNQ